MVPNSLIENAKKIIHERVPGYNLMHLYRTKQGGDCRYLPIEELEESPEVEEFLNETAFDMEELFMFDQ